MRILTEAQFTNILGELIELEKSYVLNVDVVQCVQNIRELLVNSEKVVLSLKTV